MTNVWTAETVHARYEQPFMDLLHEAHTLHRTQFNPNEMECCTLVSIKTGRCPEDCAYCPQSAHYSTGLEAQSLMSVEAVSQQAKAAKQAGASRLCLGAAWRNPPKKDFPIVLAMIKAVKAEGLEACVTLGSLTESEAQQCRDAGLDYYNHNLDTSPEYYEKIITTRTYQDRLDTLANVAKAGLNTCCGGIVGMGETREDRVQFLLSLLALPTTPKSIPINQLIAIPGTPLAETQAIEPFELIRTIAITRLLFPSSRIRLSAGRENMSDEMQAWCFYAGANSIFFGEKLLTAKNPGTEHDLMLLKTLGIAPMTDKHDECAEQCA